MGRLHLTHLDGRIYACKYCQTHLALVEDVVSKQFHCRHGKAYLFAKVSMKCNSPLSSVWKSRILLNPCVSACVLLMKLKRVNVLLGYKEERMMITGLHTVSDIFCIGCGSIVGWKYEVAPDKAQKYKEGKFILERVKVDDFNGTNLWVNSEAQVGGSDADDAGD